MRVYFASYSGLLHAKRYSDTSFEESNEMKAKNSKFEQQVYNNIVIGNILMINK